MQKRSQEQLDERKAWSVRHTRCQICHVSAHIAQQKFWPGLETHEIIGGSGRVFDPRNYLRLCHRCHTHWHEGRGRGWDGLRLPPLELCHMMWVKREADPEEYDAAFLLECRGKKNGSKYVPEPERLPDEFYCERIRNA